jgi:hypothetical protein
MIIGHQRRKAGEHRENKRISSIDNMNMKKIIKLILIIVPLVVVTFVLLNWDHFYRHDTDIDLNTGALRNRYFFWIIPIRSKIKDTDFSVLVSKYVKEQNQPNWDVEVRTGDWTGGRFSVGGKRISACIMFVTAISLSHLDPGDKELDTAKEEELVKEALSYLKQGKAEEIKKLANKILDEYTNEETRFI